MTKSLLKNLKQLPYGGASAVLNPAIELAIDEIIKEHAFSTWHNDVNIQNNFLEEYRHWINQSQLNYLENLTQFKISCYSLGTSESFDKFYLKHKSKRLRCFKGEYMYHMVSWRNYFPNWCYIEQDDLQEGDAVVVSMPFSDTGEIHKEMNWLLDICDKKNIPVLIDCAFYGTCNGINFNFDRECITDIVFSLSKTFPVSNLRIGMRLTRIDDDDSLLVHHKTGYTNRIGAGLGIELLKKYSADYNYLTWSKNQMYLCNQLLITPSSSVIFGIDYKGNRSEYNRGNLSNRLCLSKYLYSNKLPND